MIEASIEDSLREFPVVGLVGPRQAGKTTLAKMILEKMKTRSLYLDLELSSDVNKLRDPEMYLRTYEDRLVIIDEIQRMPELFPLIRALVDQKRSAGRFLVLGSASPALVRQASETLAGRIVYRELLPFCLDEIGQKNSDRLWLRGGYPLSYLAAGIDESYSWREAFIRTYLEMDIPQLGIRVPASQLRRFWTMLAHSHGQLWNASKIAGSLGISAPTAKHYLDILSDTFVVRQLQPFFVNVKKRLIKSPKVYIRDPGLFHALMRIKERDDLDAHPCAGASWEGFVIEQIIAIKPDDWEAYFYRTSAGAEIDLLLLDGKGRPTAIEIKYSLSPKPGRGFWSATDDLACEKAFVIFPGDESYPLKRNVFTLPVTQMNRIFH
ncbi:MAG: ATP-binding protein [Syntrophorhabdaceae bacterium]|nr:ATP-binding protein [Syntrophorhabdaceae bacterium]